jgi:protein polybromo-1
MVDDSIDGPPSIGSDIATASPLPTPSTHSVMATPVTTGTGRRTGKGSRRLVTGYILYSSEHRKSICASNPEASFGDISRMVGLEWKALPEDTRRIWEEKASKLNEENAIKYAEANALLNESGCSSPIPDRAQPQPIVQEILPNQV